MFELLKKIFDNVVNIFHHIKCNLSCCSSVVNVKVVDFNRQFSPENASARSAMSRKSSPFSRGTSSQSAFEESSFIRGRTD